MGNNESREGDHEHCAPPPSPANTDYRHARWPSFTDPSSGESRPNPPRQTFRTPTALPSRLKSPDVLVVGVCSSGKSTLVRKLREAGYNARACAQEHSYVPRLWQRTEPRALVYLDASLGTVRVRRRANWPQQMLDEQHRRLSHAREHCDLYIPTDALSTDDVASQVIAYLAKRTSGQQRVASESWDEC